jgi:hypothetical protein
MSKYLLLSPETPMTQTERKANGNRIGKFLIQAKKLRDAVIRGEEPNGTERMNRFRLLVDISSLFESDKACKIFRDFIEFQNDYKDYQKWKQNRLDRKSHPNRGASGTSGSTGLTEPDPFYQHWMGGTQNTSTYSSGYSNRFGIDTMGISSIFQNRQDEDTKLNYDDESDIEDFDDLDGEQYYDMVDRAYNGIETRSRLCRATRGTRKFYTDIELEEVKVEDDENDEQEPDNTSN